MNEEQHDQDLSVVSQENYLHLKRVQGRGKQEKEQPPLLDEPE